MLQGQSGPPLYTGTGHQLTGKIKIQGTSYGMRGKKVALEAETEIWP